MLWIFQRVFFEKSNEKTAAFRDLSPVETLTLLPIVILIIFMGVYPQPFISKVVPAAQHQLAAFLAPAGAVDGLAHTVEIQEQK